MTRRKLLEEAADRCIKELYQNVTPKVEWEDFVNQCKEYSKKYKEWQSSKDNTKAIDCIGPAPYAFYYIPKEIYREIKNSYIYTYKIDEQQNLLDIIQILKNYCKEPIVDKYIDDYTDEHGNHHPGYRGYDHPDNLEKEIFKIIDDDNIPLYQPPIKLVFKLRDKFFEFLDMAGNFYNWNRELGAFNFAVVDVSPCSNKETVTKNWKKYRNQDIEINDHEILREYYGDEDE